MSAASTLFKILCLALVVILLTAPEVKSQADIPGPPMRPEVFRNPQELRNYLRSLNEYFAIVGRPR